MQDLQSGTRWSGFEAASREVLEAGMLWQSADELRHYENLMATLASQSGTHPCEGKPQVSVYLLCTCCPACKMNFPSFAARKLPVSPVNFLFVYLLVCLGDGR